nr:MFS transporter [Kineosporia rhizophila]
MRRFGALFALALGGFAVGLTEFVVMGLLPDIARDLLPEQYATDREAAIARTGWLISAYALGVVAGAPTIAALTARVQRKPLVLGLLGLFVVGTAASALAPSFEWALLARFIGGIPHGAYFGAAGLLASRLLGPGAHAKGFSLVIAGLTVSNVVGVPAITYLGQATDWRVAYLAVAAAFALTLFAVLAIVPPVTSTVIGSPRAELGSLRSGQVWLTALAAAIGFSAFMAIYTYAAPMTTSVAGLSESAVPWVLATAGLGMTVGNVLGGYSADRDLPRSMTGGFVALLLAGAVFWVIARNPVGLFVGVFLVSACGLFLAPALQARLIQVAPGALLMGAALSQSAMNTANSLGAWLGGLVIAGGFGYLSPAVVAVVLSAVGLGLTVFTFNSQKNNGRVGHQAYESVQ